MEWWILGILIALTIAVAVGMYVYRPSAKAAAERRRRYVLDDSGQRLPMAGEAEPGATPTFEDPPGVFIQPSPPRASGEPGTLGRVVHTVDGDMLLTSPPFAQRDTIFNHRQARFANALIRRLPAWAVVCPKVRLDTILTPTRPDGRDPADWREWRRRIRLRSIDLLVCDRRTWKPVLAIVFSSRNPSAAITPGGGEDRMVDEVLRVAGVSMVRVRGDLKEDWPVIAPHVEALILAPISDDQVFDAADRLMRVDQDAAVKLLKKEGDEGWLLE
ncbi:MAG: DUF2726 domain-containing protein [Phycisphaerales bacterium]|nr:DUF2726 domain-containing protein [Phycisphaerales bacterium]